MTPNLYSLTDRERDRLRWLLHQLPDVTLDGAHLTCAAHDAYRTLLARAPELTELRDAFQKSLFLSSAARGYLLLDGIAAIMDEDFSDLRLPTAIASLIAHEIRYKGSFKYVFTPFQLPDLRWTGWSEAEQGPQYSPDPQNWNREERSDVSGWKTLTVLIPRRYQLFTKYVWSINLPASVKLCAE